MCDVKGVVWCDENYHPPLRFSSSQLYLILAAVSSLVLGHNRPVFN